MFIGLTAGQDSQNVDGFFFERNFVKDSNVAHPVTVSIRDASKGFDIDSGQWGRL